MSTPMRISLRAGERIYINGAVLRAERKLTFELLNNASFLLENHIIQAEEATTPLRQLYFALQTLLIDPTSSTARDAYVRIYAATRVSFSTTDVVVGLRLVGRLVDGGPHLRGAEDTSQPLRGRGDNPRPDSRPTSPGRDAGAERWT